MPRPPASPRARSTRAERRSAALHFRFNCQTAAFFFTLPWRGRVDRLSVSENDRGGVIFACFVFIPPRSLSLATLPLQGRVKRSRRDSSPVFLSGPGQAVAWSAFPFASPINEGARNAGATTAPQLCARCELLVHRHSHHEVAGSPALRARCLLGLLRLTPGGLTLSGALLL